jgi:hypothetical protein
MSCCDTKSGNFPSVPDVADVIFADVSHWLTSFSRRENDISHWLTSFLLMSATG